MCLDPGVEERDGRTEAISFLHQQVMHEKRAEGGFSGLPFQPGGPDEGLAGEGLRGRGGLRGECPPGMKRGTPPRTGRAYFITSRGRRQPDRKRAGHRGSARPVWRRCACFT